MQKQFRHEGGKRYNGIRFGPTPNIVMEEYLDMYEGIQSEILNTIRFDKTQI